METQTQQTFEYKLAAAASPLYPTELMNWLNAFGAEGWELTCHDYGYFIFKREVKA